MAYRGGPAYVALLERCRKLRTTSTDAETLLWGLLRARQLAGVKFRRQHQFGPYVLDFYCPEKKLAIEVDGGRHAGGQQAERDSDRDSSMQAQGIRVLRFSNTGVLQETEGVLMRIWEAVTAPL
jgi:very-short-patch-repair endonuclease